MLQEIAGMELGNLHKSSRPENFSYPLLLEWFSNNPILPSSKYVLYILVLFLPVTLMIMPKYTSVTCLWLIVLYTLYPRVQGV